MLFYVFFFKQKTAYEMRISDWSSDVCSSDLSIAMGRRLVVARVCRRGEPQLNARSAAWLAVDRNIAGMIVRKTLDRGEAQLGSQIGRASCRERVCPYV